MNKNNNFIYHFAIFLFSSIGIFLTYRMHMLNSLELDCGSGGCSNVFNSFHLFGISNIYIGMVHYTTLSALSFISLYSSDKINKWNISIRNTLIIVGFLYSIFLMLYLILGEIGFCELCFYSACISTILFFSVIKSGFKNTSININNSTRYLYTISAAIIALLIVFHNPTKSESKIKNLTPTEIEKHIKEAKVYNIPISGSVVWGNPNAKVTITEFTDFQ